MGVQKAKKKRLWVLWLGNSELEGPEVQPKAFVFTGRETEAQGGEGAHLRPGVSLWLWQDSNAGLPTLRLAFPDLQSEGPGADAAREKRMSE